MASIDIAFSRALQEAFGTFTIWGENPFRSPNAPPPFKT
jgi:hypothetical protein